MSNNYDPAKWYWLVIGNSAQVYGSASDTFVSTDNAAYEAWLELGNFPTLISANDLLLIRIENLESRITPRRMREAILGEDNGWLAGIESEIADLREQII